MKSGIVSIIVFTIILSSCNRTLVPEVMIDERMLDTLTVTATPLVGGYEQTLPIYRSTTTRTVDLLHTSIDISFDWDASQVIAIAELELTPYITPIESISLDAKDFTIHEVRLNGSATDDFSYDKDMVEINLGKSYRKGEKIKILIDYTAHPNGQLNPDAAITSNQGLFFIDPRGEIASKPTQIWTQGETEYNSRWFPTIDKPNERCTQEIKVTVPDNLVSLSNGKLVSSKSIGGNLRQDHWVQDLPHAPYLFMLAIGDYAVVEEVKDNIEYQYLVYPEFEADAKQIFNHTPEMVQFFADLVDYPYPWDKYSQVIAEDYVSGAMENTTAVIFGEFVQKDSRALLDDPNDKIVAHELFHHWFGDLVTCESWSNLTMNEGFANYGEYLWLEHKYGKDAAEEHRLAELDAYLVSTSGGDTHDLIHFDYADKEDMFDVHSYNKGGLVLHMLRDKLGDEVFFAGLSHYLHDNEFSSVEAHDLRLAMEEVSGQDLTVFFNQWYFASGHPSLNIETDYGQDSVTITVVQEQQEPAHLPIYYLELHPKIYYADGTTEEVSMTIDSRVERLTIPGKKEIVAVIADGRHTVLGEIQTEELTPEQSEQVILYSDSYVEIMEEITSKAEITSDAWHRISTHPSPTIRSTAIDLHAEHFQVNQLFDLLEDDPSSQVRKSAIYSIATLGNIVFADKAAKIGMQDDSYEVQKQAISIEYAIDSGVGEKIIDSLLVNNPIPYLDIISDVKAQELTEEDLPFYREYLDQSVDQSVYYTVNDYLALSKSISPAEVGNSIRHLSELKSYTNEYYKSYLYNSAITDLKKSLKESLEDYEGSDKMELQKLLEIE